MKFIITRGFNDALSNSIGTVTLTEEGVKLFEDMKVAGVDMVIAAGYLIDSADTEQDPQHIRLVGLSVIPAEQAVDRRNPNEQ